MIKPIRLHNLSRYRDSHYKTKSIYSIIRLCYVISNTIKFGFFLIRKTLDRQSTLVFFQPQNLLIIIIICTHHIIKKRNKKNRILTNNNVAITPGNTL